MQLRAVENEATRGNTAKMSRRFSFDHAGRPTSIGLKLGGPFDRPATAVIAPTCGFAKLLDITHCSSYDKI